MFSFRDKYSLLSFVFGKNYIFASVIDNLIVLINNLFK